MQPSQERPLFIADPPCVYFPVSSIGTVLRQFIRIINVGSNSARLGFPRTSGEHPSLTASVEAKQGYLASGLHQDMEIQYCPESYDVVQSKVHVDGEAIGEATRREQVAIPVYCYPAATSFRFPRHIVFDNVIVGSSRKRIFKLAVDIPVSFEFAISVNRQHTDFHVSPLTGTIPGNGAVDITILFEPCALQTHRIELTLTSSQFKSKPCTCTVLGTVKAGATRDQMIRAYTGDLPVTMTVLDSDNLVQDARKQVYPYSAKGGAGHGDPVTEAAWQARKKQSRSNPVKHSEGLSRAWTMPKPLNPTRVYHSTVARLLMDASKPDTGSESLTSNCDDAATSDSAWEHLSPFDNLALDTDTKKSLFREQKKVARDRQKTIKLSRQLEPGRMRPIDSDVQSYKALQLHHAAQIEKQEAQAAAARRVTRLKSTGARNFHVEVPSTDAAAEHESSQTQALRHQRPSATVLQRLRCADTSNALAKRAHSLKRFISAASTVVIRNRVQKRLSRLQALLSDLDWDKERVKREVAVPKLLAQHKMGMRPGIDPALVRSETDTTSLVPLEYNAVNFFRTDPVPVSSFSGYEDLETADVEVPYEFVVLGYEREEHFGYEEYVPEMVHPRMETGAIDEDIQPHPCARLEEFLPDQFDPSWFTDIPQTSFQGTVTMEDIGKKWSPNQTGVVTAPYTVWGSRGNFQTTPAMLAKHDCADREELASGTLRAIAGLPMLSEAWCPQLEDHRIGSRCQQVDLVALDGPNAAHIQAACTSQLWEDGVVDVPVQRPTQEAISEWIPENTKGGGHATEEKACTSLSDHHVAEDAFFQGRQDAHRAAQEVLQSRLAKHRKTYHSLANALNQCAKLPSKNYVR